jgi:hypothetical protein
MSSCERVIVLIPSSKSFIFNKLYFLWTQYLNATHLPLSIPVKPSKLRWKLEDLKIPVMPLTLHLQPVA